MDSGSWCYSGIQVDQSSIIEYFIALFVKSTNLHNILMIEQFSTTRNIIHCGSDDCNLIETTMTNLNIYGLTFCSPLYFETSGKKLNMEASIDAFQGST